MFIKSPTFGDRITIEKPKCRFGSSKNALKDLKHIEAQIAGMEVLPDFGYDNDNYILEHHESHNKWNTLIGLLKDKSKFEWLMKYIKLKSLAKTIEEQKEEKAKCIKKLKMAQNTTRILDGEQGTAADDKRPQSNKEIMRDLYAIQAQSKATFLKFQKMNPPRLRQPLLNTQ